MTILRRSAFLLAFPSILAGAGCVAPSADAARPGKAAPAPVQTRCRTDADCVLDPVDCSECGRCPGDTPLAVLKFQVPALEDECVRHPPARLNPKAHELGLAVPSCSPCAGPVEVQILWKPVCRQGACAVEQAGTQERPRPGPADLVIPPPDQP